MIGKFTVDTSVWQFLTGCVGGEEPQHVFCAVELIDEAEAGMANSAFVVHHQNLWYFYEAMPEWTAIAIAAARYAGDSHWVVVAMSQAGAIWEMRPLDRTERFSAIPNHIAMTSLATINQTIYACGMGRVVARRESSGTWTDLSAPWPKPEEGVIGFTSMTGLDESCLYAVGWAGEIWTLIRGQWRREDSPTNANLNAAAISQEGIVYIVGDDGSMIVGQQGQWDLIDTGTDFNLMDVCVHEGDVFVCTDFQVFRMTESGLMPDFSDDSEDLPQTCLKLISAGDGGLYSLGPYDVFLRSNGRWQRLA